MVNHAPYQQNYYAYFLTLKPHCLWKETCMPVHHLTYTHTQKTPIKKRRAILVTGELHGKASAVS